MGSDQRAVSCRHHWRNVGPAPAFRGQSCILWCCDSCGKEWETFADCKPSLGRGRAVIVSG